MVAKFQQVVRQNEPMYVFDQRIVVRERAKGRLQQGAYVRKRICEFDWHEPRWVVSSAASTKRTVRCFLGSS